MQLKVNQYSSEGISHNAQRGLLVCEAQDVTVCKKGCKIPVSV